MTGLIKIDPLFRGPNDFTLFPNKAIPVGNDKLLIEDSAASGAKKYVLISSLPGGGSGITPGTTAQYYRGDLTWQTLNKAAVGLGNVDNTSDLNKPISNATQTALNAKQNSLPIGSATQYFRGDLALATLNKVAVGLSNVDNTSDLNKPISNATQTALNAKQNTIVAGTTAQYYRGDLTWQTLNKAAVGLGNVDNTSDLNKPISTATQTALNAKQNTITLGTTAQYFRGDLSLATLDKSGVGLGNVDNTSDLNKPISTATQTALSNKVDKIIGVTGGTVGSPTQTVTITYNAQGQITAATAQDISITASQVQDLESALEGSFLTRSADDFASFQIKNSPSGGDILLIEDSEAGGAKKKITIASIGLDGGTFS